MKKAILVWTAIMTAGMLALAGCGKKETGQAGEYTNLADKESRKAVVGELEACGVTKEEMAEILTHAAFYVGWPKAWAAFRFAKEIYKENE